jgi:hypothetical protein
VTRDRVGDRFGYGIDAEDEPHARLARQEVFELPDLNQPWITLG